MINCEQAHTTLDELKKAKEDVEKQVTKLLTDLETKYGVKVSYFNFFNSKLSLHLSLDFDE